MRLDEWQRYIDTQFLDDEPQPAPTPNDAVSNSPQSAIAASHPQQLMQPDHSVESTTADLPLTPQLETVNPIVSTAPNPIQNMLTVVVAPAPTPVMPPPNRKPRIDILTPLPAPIPDLKATRGDKIDAVANRTRRRSHLPTPSPSTTVPVNKNSPTSEPETNHNDPIELQSPFTALERASAETEIPSFANYLPIAHVASIQDVSESKEFNKNNSEPRTVQLDANAGLTLQPIAYPADRTKGTDGQEDDGQEDDGQGNDAQEDDAQEDDAQEDIASQTSRKRTPKTRARHARNVRPEHVPSGLSASELWATVPRHVQTLLSLERMEENEVAQFSYKRPFQEKRHELIERLLDPILSLEDTARLLNVCPTTVRRYTNKGILTYYRKEPDRNGKTSEEPAHPHAKETRQRRFRLSDILAFLETQQAAIEADRKAELQAERRRQERASKQPATEPAK